MAKVKIEITASGWGGTSEVEFQVHQDSYTLTVKQAKHLRAELKKAITQAEGPVSY